MAEQTCDIRKNFVQLCYGDDFRSKFPAYLTGLPKTLEQYEAFLGDNVWLAGPHITWAGMVFPLMKCSEVC